MEQTPELTIDGQLEDYQELFNLSIYVKSNWVGHERLTQAWDRIDSLLDSLFSAEVEVIEQ